MSKSRIVQSKLNAVMTTHAYRVSLSNLKLNWGRLLVKKTPLQQAFISNNVLVLKPNANFPYNRKQELEPEMSERTSDTVTHRWVKRGSQHV